jgi:predicted DNA-binding protein (UPF0251 family)
MSQLARVSLGLDELEAMRLCDVEGLEQEAAGERMGVSRGTIQRLLQSGRSKVVGALLDSSALIIEREATDATLHTDAG